MFYAAFSFYPFVSIRVIRGQKDLRRPRRFSPVAVSSQFFFRARSRNPRRRVARGDRRRFIRWQRVFLQLGQKISKNSVDTLSRFLIKTTFHSWNR